MRGALEAAGVKAICVPGSSQVKKAAEAEGLDRIFREAGFEWRESGCSMCIGMNGDIGAPGQLVVVDKVDPNCNRLGGAFLGYNIRAKFVIDSVNTSRRAIYLKVLSNPNCGFKSLEPGEPKD